MTTGTAPTIDSSCSSHLLPGRTNMKATEVIAMSSSRRFSGAVLAAAILLPTTSLATVKVVTTQETYASIAREIGGDLVTAEPSYRATPTPTSSNPSRRMP